MTEPKKSGGALKLGLRLLGPVLLAVVLWRLDDPGALWRSFASASRWLLVLAVAINPIILHLKIVRWKVLLKDQGIEYSTKRAWLAYLSGAYLAMLTPGRVGDVLRVQYLKRDLGVSYAEGLASVVMDRFCDLYVLAAFVAGAAVHFGPILAPELAWATWLCVVATFIGPLVFVVPGVPERVLSPVFKKISPRFGDPDGAGFDRFLAALRANVGWGLAITIPLTAVTFVLNYVQGSLIAASMGMDISFVDVTCLLAIASLLGLLPISVSGVGMREAFFAIVFPSLGHSAEQGVTFGLLVFGVIYVAITLAGFVAWQVAPPPIGENATPIAPPNPRS